jgi:hypothetical protein
VNWLVCGSALSGRAERSQILMIERAQRRFHRCADADNPLLDIATEHSHPFSGADSQLRTPHSGRAAGVRGEIQFRAFVRCHGFQQVFVFHIRFFAQIFEPAREIAVQIRSGDGMIAS